MDKDQILHRFLRYVQIDTTANPATDDYPSSPGQLELGKLLVEELKEMGIENATQNEHGIVMATVPATDESVTDTICWCAHLDTSPETSGTNVKPQIIENYQGGDIVLPGDTSKVITIEFNPELNELIGHTIITSDGTTLLGGDDKAGVAIIFEAAKHLMEHPEIKHGPIRICLTCDEEIARGVIKLDLDEIASTVCYTVDGHGGNEIDVETFSADQAVVTFTGMNIHPAVAKGRMVNAIRAAGDFITRLPRETQSPETTDGRDGFLHPYEIEGGVGEMKLKILLREFDASKLDALADKVRECAAATAKEFPKAKIDVVIERQYRNMDEGLKKEPRAVAYAEEALSRLGRTAKKAIIRGGTDGSRLTEMGLPSPNLSSADHTPHAAVEWVCLEEMIESSEWLVSIAEVWGEKK